MMTVSPAEVSELCGFLHKPSNRAVLTAALEYVCGVTATPDGISFINRNEILKPVLDQIISQRDNCILELALKAVANCCESALAASNCAKKDGFLLKVFYCAGIVNDSSPEVINISDEVSLLSSKLLSNISRFELCSKSIFHLIHEETLWARITDLICTSPTHRYLMGMVANLCRMKEARLAVLDPSRCIFERLSSYLCHSDTSVRRNTAILIKNCSFDSESHGWLMETMQIHARVLLPLAGGEEFDEKDTERLPIELQYLPADKAREQDPRIRCLLLETLQRLCVLPAGRKMLRDCNAYIILRELDKAEQDADVSREIDKVVMILAGDEPEPGMENLSEVAVPKDLESRLIQMEQTEHPDTGQTTISDVEWTETDAAI